MDIEQVVKQRLQAGLEQPQITVINESHLHVGHEGARGGKCHLRLQVVSPSFAGMSPLAQQRLVYQLLGELMEHPIHALSMDLTA